MHLLCIFKRQFCFYFTQNYKHMSTFGKMQQETTTSVSNVHLIQVPDTLKIARRCLLNGDIIALPTDTVYGLACDANNELAIQKLYDIKGRNCYKPVAICVKDIIALRRYGKAEHLTDYLLESLLPGPITIVIERSSKLSNRFLNPNTSKIGIRIPDFSFIRELCSLWDEQPLALTSANLSSEPSSLNIFEFKSLWPQLGAIIDAGQIGCTEEQRSASTVIDLTIPGRYIIVRAGVGLKKALSILHANGFDAVNN